VLRAKTSKEKRKEMEGVIISSIPIQYTIILYIYDNDECINT